MDFLRMSWHANGRDGIGRVDGALRKGFSLVGDHVNQPMAIHASPDQAFEHVAAVPSPTDQSMAGEGDPEPNAA